MKRETITVELVNAVVRDLSADGGGPRVLLESGVPPHHRFQVHLASYESLRNCAPALGREVRATLILEIVGEDTEP